MKRVALISEHASPLAIIGGPDAGGQNVYVGQLARNLAASGYLVDVFTRRDSELLPECAEWVKGVRIVHVPAGPPEHLRKEELLPHMPAFTSWTTRFMRRQRPGYDIVHANFFMSGLAAADIKRALGIPFVVTFHALGRVRRQHQGDADHFPDERFDIEDRIVTEADALIAECPQDEEDLIGLYNADPARITIIPCGFDQTEFSPVSKALARVAIGLPPDEPLLLQLGRMVPRKGVDNAIRGFGRLVHEHRITARMLIVGGEAEDPDPSADPEIRRLMDVADEEGVADRVRFLGRRGRDVLNYYYNAADVFISTPWYEPFGITPVEAMACSTPVVGSNVGGIKFTVRDGETGYLVTANDPDALADRVAHLYRNPKLLSVFGRQAVRRANDLFTWQKVATAVAELYEQVITAAQPEEGGLEEIALVDRTFDAAALALATSRHRLRRPVVEAARSIGDAVLAGGKVLVCGNGGSAADAQHFAAELVGRFKRAERRALPALALTSDTAVLTAWANDIDFDEVFARQVEAHGRPGDVLVAMSTSGRSRNVIRALETARERGLRCIGLLGGTGGDAAELADQVLLVPSPDAQRIQEVHGVLVHVLSELVEEQVAGGRAERAGAGAVPTIWELQRRRAAPVERSAAGGRRGPRQKVADAADRPESVGAAGRNRNA